MEQYTSGNTKKKINEKNKTNAEFMKFAKEHAPWLVQKFFEEKKAVIFFIFYYVPNRVKTQISFNS